MSKKLKFLATMLTCILLSINQLWATPKATYTWTANPGTEKDYFNSTSGNVTLGSYTWAYTQGSAETNYNSSGYIQLGARYHSVGAFSLTLTNTDPVKSVTVDCASYSGSSSISISIGGTSYLASTATPTFSNNSGGTRGGNELATPLTGNIAINFTASSRALYIKSITIVYGEAGGSTKTLVYNANGATGGSVPTDATAYNVGDKAPVKGNTGSLYKIGHTFAGWTDNSAGTGTVYTSGDKFTIASSGNTLYAKWTNTYAGREFSLVEDLNELSAGSKIIILNAGHTYAISRTQATNNRTAVSASAEDNAGFTMSNSNKTVTLKSATTVQVITLEDLATPVTNTYQFNVENGYLYAAGSGSGSNYLKTQSTNDANGHWLIELTSETFSIVAQGTNTNNTLKHNSTTTTIFSCYASGQENVLIYVLDEGTKYEITWDKNGHGTAPTSPTNASKVTLPDISVTGYTNTGWKADKAVTNASTSATITTGTLITNGTRVILGAATTFTAQWETDTYTITTSGLTNISPTSAFPANVTYTGSTDHSLDRILQAADGYVLPATITVTMGGSTLTAGTDYTYSSSNGAFAISKVITDNIVISGSAYLRLDGIAVTTDPTKLAYFAGESFSNAGAEVTATMGDNTTKTVTATWTPPATPLVAGASQTVSISYTENGMTKNTSVTINVYSVTVNTVNENGEAVDVSGVTASWTVGTKGLSASASSASKYVFKEWAFSGSNQGLAIASASVTSTTVSGTPTGDVVINAVFWAPRSVVWMVNEEAYTKGSPTSTIAYNSSWSDLSLPTDPTIPCGDKFMGWTTTEIGSNGLDKDDDAAAIVALDLMTNDNKSGKTANKITAATTTFHAVLADYVEPAD